LNDPYVKKSRYANYRARSAFKLIEIDDKFRLLKPGMVVVECGAAPGAWTQVLVERLQPEENNKSLIISIDRNPINPITGAHLLPNSDMTSSVTHAKVLSLLDGRLADFVCSDMAPNAVGMSCVDHEGIINLSLVALRFALPVLNPGGAFLTKLWSGSRDSEMGDLLRKFFTNVKIVKPPASRCDSSEHFMLATGFSGIRK
jgi:23S rRNA (uridine2552-2'-O)-methyltransferase